MSEPPLTYEDDLAIVRLDLDPQGVEFLLNHLPEKDEFTKELAKMRDRARFLLWEREAYV